MGKLINNSMQAVEASERAVAALRDRFVAIHRMTASRLKMVCAMIRGERRANQDLTDLKTWRREVDQLLSAIKTSIARDEMTNERYQEHLAEFNRTSQEPALRTP